MNVFVFDVNMPLCWLCVCVCLKKALCGVRPALYCTSRVFPGQQEEGWVDSSHTQVCVFVCVLFLEGKEHRKYCDHYYREGLYTKIHFIVLNL